MAIMKDRIKGAWGILVGTIWMALPVLAQAVGAGTVNPGFDGDDFSNNLFSDLAPILSLFGEQVTKQFISQSMGWADHIIFAMGPIGVITAIVSAIRVAGPRWMKAFIGRALETTTITELELLSSTSSDVCEVWNGQTIIRIMGSPRILQLIVFPAEANGAFNLYNLEEAVGEGKLCISSTHKSWHDRLGNYLQVRHENRKDAERSSIKPSYKRAFMDKLWNIEDYLMAKLRERDIRSPAPLSSQQTGSNILQVKSSPNIFFNLRPLANKGEMWAAAILGLFLQFGVLAYSACITYHPALAWGKVKKDNRPVLRYAYPLVLIGTLILVTGMLLCSYIIEKRTIETIWTENDQSQNSNGKRKFRVMWIQQGGQIVNDQSLESYVVFAGHECEHLLTSQSILGVPSAHKNQNGLLSLTSKFLYRIAHKSSKSQQSLSDPPPVVSPAEMTPLGSPRTFPEEEAPESSSLTGPILPTWQVSSTPGNMETDTSPQELPETGLSSPPINQSTGQQKEAVESPLAWGFQVLVFAAAIICISGYILQFIGLRGMHWSATIAQLIVSLIMVGVRASVRRGLASSADNKKLTQGHELDRLAINLVDGSFPPLKDNEKGKTATKGEDSYWTIPLLSNYTSYRILPSPDSGTLSEDARSETSDPDSGKAQRINQVRQRLGVLARWPSTSLQPAVSVAKAIEVFLNEFTRHNLQSGSNSLQTSLTWSIPVEYNKKLDSISISATRGSKEKWTVNSGSIEAVLSLWLYHFRSLEIDRMSSQVTPRDEDWPRKEPTVPRKERIWLLGPLKACTARDLSWYFGLLLDTITIQVIEFLEDPSSENLQESQIDAQSIDGQQWTHGESGKDEIIGLIEGDQMAVPASRDGKFSYQTRPLHLTDWWYLDSDPHKTPRWWPSQNGDCSAQRRDHLAVIVDMETPIEFLLARTLFSGFVRAAASGVASVDLSRDEARQLREDAGDTKHEIDPKALQNAKFEHHVLSQLANEISRVGLGTREEASLCLIPWLSLQDKMPSTLKVIEAGRKIAEDKGDQCYPGYDVRAWQPAFDEYAWLFKLGTTFKRLERVRATAIFTEYIDSIEETLLVLDAQGAKTDTIDLVEGFVEKGKALLKEGTDAETAQRINKMLENQGRLETLGKPLAGFQKKLAAPIQSDEFIYNEGMEDAFGWTRLHYKAVQSKWLSGNEKLYEKTASEARERTTLRGWTPLHIAVTSPLPRNDLWALNQISDLERFTKACARNGMRPLHMAAATMNRRTMKDLMSRQGTDATAVDKYGWTALHWAALAGMTPDFEWAKLTYQPLARRGKGQPQRSFNIRRLMDLYREVNDAVRSLEAGVTVRDKLGRLPVHLAVINHHPQMTNRLLRLAQDMNLDEQWGDQRPTALGLATLHNYEECLTALLKAGANPLGVACHSVQAPAISKRLELPAEAPKWLNTRFSDEQRWTPLYLAAVLGHEDVVKTLLQYCNPFSCDTDGWTVLHAAAAGGHDDVVRAVLADTHQCRHLVGARDRYLMTALDWASLYDRGAVVETLQATTVYPGLSESMFARNVPQLYQAVRRHDTTTAQKLVHAAADSNGLSYSPLHIAVRYGFLDMAKLLLNRSKTPKEDMMRRDRCNWDPLWYAVYHGHAALVEFLYYHLADENIVMNAVYGRGWNLLHCALSQSHDRIIQSLIKHRANTNAVTDDGWTVLHLLQACYSNGSRYDDIIKSLDPQVMEGRDKAQWTALDTTAMRQNLGSKASISMISATMEPGNMLVEAMDDMCRRTSVGLGPNISLRLTPNATRKRSLLQLFKNKDIASDQFMQRRDLLEELVPDDLFKMGDKMDRDQKGRSLLHWWAMTATETNTYNKHGYEGDSHDVLFRILERGSRGREFREIGPGPRDYDQLTALHWWARANEYTGAGELLLSNGIPINLRDNKNRTALHWAAEQGTLWVVKCLLNHGADRYALAKHNDQDKTDGKSPKELAEDRRRMLQALQTSLTRNSDAANSHFYCTLDFHIRERERVIEYFDRQEKLTGSG